MRDNLQLDLLTCQSGHGMMALMADIEPPSTIMSIIGAFPMNYKQMVLDYLEGRMEYHDFQNEIDNNADFIQWFQYVVPSTCFSSTIPTPENNFKGEQIPFDLKADLKLLEHFNPKGSLAFQLNFQSLMSRLIKEAFPDIHFKVDPTIDNMYTLILEAVPSYIGGAELSRSGFIERMIQELPDDWSKTKKIKELRERIKAAFHIEGRNYPHWVQSPEWPLSNGKPMKYVKTTVKYKGEWYQHHFVDVDTGEETIVDDAY